MKKKNRKKKSSSVTLILVIAILAGLSLLLYPTVSNWWNSFHATKAISEYNEKVSRLDTNEVDKIIADAKKYNKKLFLNPDRYNMSNEEIEEYNSLLNPTGNGMMGYVEIPSIDISLPIYHGTSEATLSASIGHIPGTSLPIGGKSTHSVLSGHRGLPSAKLFTNLDKMTEGDIFTITTINTITTYQVDQIRIVLPNEVNDLAMEEGKDYCTLVTCTPYGINSHRLLVRGHRVPNKTKTHIVSDAVQIDTELVSIGVAIPILILLFIALMVNTRKKSKLKKKKFNLDDPNSIESILEEINNNEDK